MTNFLLKSISPQSAKIYTVLETGKPMTAKDIGRRLNIFPNAVYRAVKQLLELGFVQEIHDYPIKYQAKRAADAMDLYSMIMRQNFQETFSSHGFKQTPSQALRLKFIHNRNELLLNSNRDMKYAKSQLNYIVSGHEVPADTILSFKQATDRGVKIRVLAQQLDSKKGAMFKNWLKVGVEVRYYPSIEARIFTIDRRIVYFTSYDPDNIQEAIGMRFEYTPYALLMDELFEQKWKMGEAIT